MTDLQPAFERREWEPRPSGRCGTRACSASRRMLSLSLFLRASLCRTFSVPRQQKSVFIGVHPLATFHVVVKNSFLQSPVKVFQGQSRLFKATQTYSRALGKKNCLFFVRRPNSFRPITVTPSFPTTRSAQSPSKRVSTSPNESWPVQPFSGNKRLFIFYLADARCRAILLRGGRKTATLQN
jgi:hypothetical protein